MTGSNTDSPRLTDGDDQFKTMNARMRPLQLKPGEVALSENGRMDVDGAWRVRDGYENVSGTILQTTDEVIIQDADDPAALWLMADNVITGSVVSGNVVTVTVTDVHGLPAHTVLLNISGLTYTGVEPNGNREVTKTTTTAFTFPLVTANETHGTGGSPLATSFTLETAPSEIRGSGKFSDVGDSNAEYIILADDAKATAFKLSDLSKAEISYPTALTVTTSVDLFQSLGSLYLHHEGQTAWCWDGTITTVTAGAFVTDTIYTIFTLGSTDYTAIGAGANVIGTVFTATGAGSGTGTAKTASAFVAVESGTKLQHKIFDSEDNTTIHKGVATVNTVEAHGLSVKDIVLVVDSTAFNFLDGTKAIVQTVPSSTSFTWLVDAQATKTGPSFPEGSDTVIYSTSASLGGGYINTPGGAGEGLAKPLYWQNRVWMPYNYTDASTPVLRGVNDELIASDILDVSTFDPIGSQFRFVAGSADFMVGIHGFDDDRILVFMRNSIHQLSGVSGSLNDVESHQLSSEIGCLARRSIANQGAQVLYLSDEGVFALTHGDEYNLRGTDLPLSEAIDPLIKRITPGSADRAIAAIHDNKYWLAVPLDGATENSHILVYSFLNNGWESIDSTNSPHWEIIDLIPARTSKVNELYAVTSTGGIHKLDGAMREKDSISAAAGLGGSATYDIPAAVTSRQYNFGNLRRKKFQRARIHLKSDDSYASDAAISAIVEDPDSTTAMSTVGSIFSGGLAAAADGTILERLGNPRGTGLQIKFTPSQGKPTLRAIQVDASDSYGSTTSTS